MTELEFHVRRYTDPDVVRLVADVQAEYVVRYGGPDESPVEPGEFDPPDGLFLVAYRDGPVAMGGWRLVEPGTVELKRMYVAPSARRQGLARRVLAALEASAVERGASRVVLGTGIEQPEAIALYESSGYTSVTGFGLYACAPGALFYGKELAARGKELAAP